MIAPNITIETPKAATLLSVKTRLPKSLSGSTGSAARRSTRTKATRARAPMTYRLIDWTDPHAHCVPPSEVASSSAVRLVARVAMPR